MAGLRAQSRAQAQVAATLLDSAMPASNKGVAFMQESIQPGDEVVEKLLQEAHRIAAPRQQLCPVCNAPLIGRNQELVCISDICRNRIVENCSDC